MIGIGTPTIQRRIERPIVISFVCRGDCKRATGLEGCADACNLDDVICVHLKRTGVSSLALLDGRTILIVENDPAIGLDLRATLFSVGATPLGPANSLERAFALIADHAIDAAILDIRLYKDELVFPVADTLQALRVPYVFASGRSTALMPLRHGDRPFFDKPFRPEQIIEALAKILDGDGAV